MPKSPDERAKELWEKVRENREQLHNADEYPGLSILEKAWNKIEDLYEGKFDREELEGFFNDPFSALFGLVEMGIYPPPELLLALSEVWEEYKIAGSRAQDLERMFLGRGSQRAGNAAKRHRKRLRDLSIKMRFWELTRQGLSRERAAEEILQEMEAKEGRRQMEAERSGYKYEKQKVPSVESLLKSVLKGVPKAKRKAQPGVDSSKSDGGRRDSKEKAEEDLGKK